MYINKPFVFAAAILLFAACQTKELNTTLDEINEEQIVEAGIPAPDITAVQEEGNNTKSTLEVDGLGVGTIYWTPADEINVFYGTTSTHYVSQNTVNATTAVFSTTDIIGISEGASENIWGLYPYNSSATCSGSAVTTTLPATQYGVPGTFDDDLYITLAHNNSTALTFYNVCGGIKFSLSRDDITSITFRGNNNEDIAGDISLAFSDGLPTVSVTNGEKEITLTPKTGSTFVSGENYYLVLLPVTLTNGFTMSFTTTASIHGELNFSTSSVIIKRSIFSKKANIDTYAMLGPVPSNQIWYTSTDGSVVTPYKVDVFGANIVSNTYAGGKGVIEFDDNVSSIGDYAFQNCSKITSISYPSCVTSLGNRAFAETGIISIWIPNTVTSIGDGVFFKCSSLSSCRLPDGIGSIPRQFFYQCSSLAAITIPDSVTTIGAYSFSSCAGITSITIPDGVTSIGSGAFDGCSGLSSIVIPEGVTSIESYLFYNCTGLTSITIPSTITGSVGNYAFYRCSNITSLSMPSTVSGLGTGVFDACTRLESFTIPSSVSSLGNYVFRNCSSLQSVVIPNSVKVIPNEAFKGCTSLESVTFPSALTDIGNWAFYECTSLLSVSLPSTLKSIGGSAFRICSNLQSFTIYATTPPSVGDYWRYSTGGYIYVPAASVNTYKTAWNSYQWIIYAIE